MIAAIAILVVALHIASALAMYLWSRSQFDYFSRLVRAETVALAERTPIVAPDPRVDELYRVVSQLRGAEALKQVFGKTN